MDFDIYLKISHVIYTYLTFPSIEFIWGLIFSNCIVINSCLEIPGFTVYDKHTRCGSHFGNFKNLSLYTSCYTKYFVKRVLIYPKFCGLSEYVQLQNVRLIIKSRDLYKWGSADFEKLIKSRILVKFRSLSLTWKLPWSVTIVLLTKQSH